MLIGLYNGGLFNFKSQIGDLVLFIEVGLGVLEVPITKLVELLELFKWARAKD